MRDEPDPAQQPESWWDRPLMITPRLFLALVVAYIILGYTSAFVSMALRPPPATDTELAISFLNSLAKEGYTVTKIRPDEPAEAIDATE